MSRPASNRIEVGEVKIVPPRRDLSGFSLRVLEAEGGSHEPRLTLRGWVVPRERPALGVEVVQAGSVLAQSHGALEIVVVDDGSPDNVGEVAARYPGVRCLRRPNGGLAAARNVGLEEATGDFLVFLDADDRLLPDAIERGLEELRTDPKAMMAAGTWRLIGEVGEPLPADPPRQPPLAFPALLESCFISTPAAVLYRRELFGQIGGFDPEVSASADYDLYLRTAARFPVRLHPHTVAEYRRHGANMTRDPELIMAAETTVLERQVPLVAEDPELREALRRGIERSREYHGERLRLFAGGPE